MTDRGVYIYAIVRSLDPDVLRGATGVRGTAVRLVRDAGLTALVSDVGLEEFGEEGLRRHLEDLAWLESVARAHNAVVELAFRHGAVAPLSLATVCFDDAGVRDRLRTLHDRVEGVLTRITGRAEMGVKVYAQPAAALERSATRTQSAAPGSSPGKAYLQRRQSEAARRDEASRSMALAAERVHDALAGGAVASRRHPRQDRRLAGHEGDMILNGSYLVGVPDLPVFEELTRTVRDGRPELRVEVTGPWPPYSFAGLDEP
jgi:hypothetical protein